MKRKMLRNLSFALITLAMVFTLVFSFEGRTNAASSTSKLDQDLKIDTVDGIKYSPDNHKKVARIVVEITDQGEKVLGFSTLQKYEEYSQQEKELSLDKNNVIMSSVNYFYEHTSNHGYGRSLAVSFGKSVPYVGSFWNDRISAIGVAPGYKVTLYQNSYYWGHFIVFNNRSERRYYTNLTSWKMGSSRTWNDQVSSIVTTYHGVKR